MADKPRFQFGLRSLLWVVTGFAVVCSAAATLPADLRGLVIEALMKIAVFALTIGGLFFSVIVATDYSALIKAHDAAADTVRKTRPQLHCGKRFWIVACSVLPFVLCLNLVPDYFSSGEYGTLGWPLAFFEWGGCSYSEHKDAVAFIVDMLVAVLISLIVGFGFRNGAAPVVARGRMLLRLVRTWPNEDSDREENG